MDTWYFSPFPPEFSSVSKLFFCEFCLAFLKRREQLERHMVGLGGAEGEEGGERGRGVGAGTAVPGHMMRGRDERERREGETRGRDEKERREGETRRRDEREGRE